MRKIIKITLGMFLALFMVKGFAIQVSVQTNSPSVAAVGFATGGKNYGKSGTSYTNASMSPGTYSFGGRVGGLLTGDDVSCLVRGKKETSITRDTMAVLKFNGTSCVANVYPMHK